MIYPRHLRDEQTSPTKPLSIVTWFETPPLANSTVQEDDCFELYKRRFGIKNLAVVLEDIMKTRKVRRTRKVVLMKRSPPSSIVQHEEVSVKSVQTVREKSPMKRNSKTILSSNYLISCASNRNQCSSTEEVFEKNSLDIDCNNTSTNQLDSDNLVSFI